MKVSKNNLAMPEDGTQNAKCHISYYSDKDKHWAEIVMKEFGCKNYQLYSSIDDCLESFKKE